MMDGTEQMKMSTAMIGCWLFAMIFLNHYYSYHSKTVAKEKILPVKQ